MVFLEGLGETIAGRCQAAAYPPDGLFEGAAHGVHHLRVGVKRLQVMGGQRVEVELLAHILEEVLLRPAREHGAGNLDQGHLRVGGDHWHLATVGQTAPDLADREPVAQYYRFLGEVNGCRALVPAGPWISYFKGAEILLRPVLAREVLVPSDAGDAAPGQTLEQVRAPALAVEHQGERRRAGVRPGQVGGRFRHHPQVLQVRHHVLLDAP